MFNPFSCILYDVLLPFFGYYTFFLPSWPSNPSSIFFILSEVFFTHCKTRIIAFSTGTIQGNPIDQLCTDPILFKITHSYFQNHTAKIPMTLQDIGGKFVHFYTIMAFLCFFFFWQICYNNFFSLEVEGKLMTIFSPMHISNLSSYPSIWSHLHVFFLWVTPPNHHFYNASYIFIDVSSCASSFFL